MSQEEDGRPLIKKKRSCSTSTKEELHLLFAEGIQIVLFVVGICGGGFVTGFIQLGYLVGPCCCCRRLPPTGPARAWAVAGVVVWVLSLLLTALVVYGSVLAVERLEEDEELNDVLMRRLRGA